MSIRDTDAMIAAMDPVMDPLFYAFTIDGEIPAAARLFATIHEAEATTAILGFVEGEYPANGDAPYRRIVLQVHSSLEGVGLTAAVSATLAEAGIACNVVAAFHHDHVFVPARRASDAMALLEGLQRRSRSGA